MFRKKEEKKEIRAREKDNYSDFFFGGGGRDVGVDRWQQRERFLFKKRHDIYDHVFRKTHKSFTRVAYPLFSSRPPRVMYH